MGMRCYHKILYISRIDHITNEEVCAKIQQAVGNIREWTGLEFTKSQRAVENREKWRKLVAK